jgi:hypothetical protein
MRYRLQRLLACAAVCATVLGASAACADIQISSPPTGAAIVTNGVFTNIYVYPDPDRESWDQHLGTLTKDVPWTPGNVPAAYTRSGIDGFVSSLTQGWPGYFDALMQYRDMWNNGISPPSFVGSKVASQACVDAALHDAVNGVVQWNTLRSLANCHADGDDPSPQLNLIISPDIIVGPVNYGPDSSGDLCGTSDGGYHTWGLNVPNFSVIPVNSRCNSSFASFTSVLSHEMVEILSDPAGMGYRAEWLNIPDTYEIGQLGDICEARKGALANGYASPEIAYLTYDGFQVSRYWSAFDQACVPQIDPPINSGGQVTWQLGAGSPLTRLSGDHRDVTLPLPADRSIPDAPIMELRLAVQTGGDNLRGDSGNLADAIVTFSTGDVATANISQSRAWENWETHLVVLNVPPNARFADIQSLRIHKNYDGGFLDCCGDNWDIARVALLGAYPVPPPPPPPVPPTVAPSCTLVGNCSGDVRASCANINYELRLDEQLSGTFEPELSFEPPYPAGITFTASAILPVGSNATFRVCAVHDNLDKCGGSISVSAPSVDQCAPGGGGGGGRGGDCEDGCTGAPPNCHCKPLLQ